jgi:hypothetical protein
MRSLTRSKPSLRPSGVKTIASAPPDTFDQAFRTQLAEVASKLAEAVLVVAEVIASDDACVQFAGGPVANEATKMQ